MESMQLGKKETEIPAAVLLFLSALIRPLGFFHIRFLSPTSSSFPCYFPSSIVPNQFSLSMSINCNMTTIRSTIVQRFSSAVKLIQPIVILGVKLYKVKYGLNLIIKSLYHLLNNSYLVSIGFLI